MHSKTAVNTGCQLPLMLKLQLISPALTCVLSTPSGGAGGAASLTAAIWALTGKRRPLCATKVLTKANTDQSRRTTRRSARTAAFRLACPAFKVTTIGKHAGRGDMS